MRILIPICLTVLLGNVTLASTALMPDHQPVGADRPLMEGDRFELLPARLYEQPAFDSVSTYLPKSRLATLLAVSNDFYYLDLGADSLYYVYRSELGVQNLRDTVQKGAERHTGSAAAGIGLVAFDTPTPPVKGERLALSNFLLYIDADLLAEHEMVSGRDTVTIEAAENANGFLRVSADGGAQGWLYRGELPEERRLW